MSMSYAQTRRHQQSLTVVHRDVSPGNILSIKQANSTSRGVLIDMDHAIPRNDERNIKMPGQVGTYPFMSIANMENLDVSRTAVDDCETALVVLLYLAAHPSRRDALSEKLSFTRSNGVADFRKQMLGSREALDQAIATYIDSACVYTVWLIRALYDALFTYPGCSGTKHPKLRGNKFFDPIVLRVRYADTLHERFLAVMTKFLAHYCSGTLVRLLLPACPAPGGLRASQDTVSRPQGIIMPPPGFLWARRADPLAASSPKRRRVF
ncbi:hypothetical protein GGI17_001407 [Coemansia sp. S146]|nr:hypothetical protein GGI17_001407 [Coemansia sp. S146]